MKSFTKYLLHKIYFALGTMSLFSIGGLYTNEITNVNASTIVIQHHATALHHKILINNFHHNSPTYQLNHLTLQMLHHYAKQVPYTDNNLYGNKFRGIEDSYYNHAYSDSDAYNFLVNFHHINSRTYELSWLVGVYMGYKKDTKLNQQQISNKIQIYHQGYKDLRSYLDKNMTNRKYNWHSDESNQLSNMHDMFASDYTGKTNQAKLKYDNKEYKKLFRKVNRFEKHIPKNLRGRGLKKVKADKQFIYENQNNPTKLFKSFGKIVDYFKNTNALYLNSNYLFVGNPYSRPYADVHAFLIKHPNKFSHLYYNKSRMYKVGYKDGANVDIIKPSKYMYSYKHFNDYKEDASSNINGLQKRYINNPSYRKGFIDSIVDTGYCSPRSASKIYQNVKNNMNSKKFKGSKRIYLFLG